MTPKQKLLRAVELELGRTYPDADEVNQTFFSPFKGMTEMYALQKGIEAGVEAEHARRLPPLHALIEAYVEMREALEGMPCRRELASAYATCCKRCDALTAADERLKPWMGGE